MTFLVIREHVSACFLVQSNEVIPLHVLLRILQHLFTEWLRDTLDEVEHLFLGVHLIINVELQKLVIK